MGFIFFLVLVLTYNIMDKSIKNEYTFRYFILNNPDLKKKIDVTENRNIKKLLIIIFFF